MAQALHITGAIERSGYGVWMMCEAAMEQGKPLPDYSNSTHYRVCLQLDGELVDADLTAQLRHSPNPHNKNLTLEQYRALCLIACGETTTGTGLEQARKQLLQAGLITSSGKGRGTSYALAHNSYLPQEMFNGDRELMLEVLSKLVAVGSSGVPFASLRHSLPGKTDQEIRKTLYSMKDEGLVRLKGRTKSSRWVSTEAGSTLYEASGHKGAV